MVWGMIAGFSATIWHFIITVRLSTARMKDFQIIIFTVVILLIPSLPITGTCINRILTTWVVSYLLYGQQDNLHFGNIKMELALNIKKLLLNQEYGEQECT